MSLITLKKSHIESELSVLRSQLEAAGIRCFLRNEMTAQIINFMPSFEVELQIDDKDLESARQIMDQLDS